MTRELSPWSSASTAIFPSLWKISEWDLLKRFFNTLKYHPVRDSVGHEDCLVYLTWICELHSWEDFRKAGFDLFTSGSGTFNVFYLFLPISLFKWLKDPNQTKKFILIRMLLWKQNPCEVSLVNWNLEN